MYKRIGPLAAIIFASLSLPAQMGMAELSPGMSFEQKISRQEEAKLQNRIEALRSAADIPECEGCTELLEDVEMLEEAYANFRVDMQASLDRMLEGSGDTILLGRYDLQELFLPYRDYIGIEQRILTDDATELSNDFGLSGMGVEPGQYTVMDILRIVGALDGNIRYRVIVAVSDLEAGLEDLLPKPVAVVPTALNLLYSGVDNPVKVWAGNADPSTVELIGPNVAKAEQEDIWTVRPEEPGVLTIEVKGQSPGGTDVRGEAEFQVRRVPKPKIFVAGRDDGVLVKNDITGTTGIVARNDDFLYTVGYKILGFEMVYTPEYGSPVNINTPGNVFTDKIRNTLKGTRRGDRLLFRVRVEYPDGVTKTQSATYYVR